jgi:hypothetical protein
VTEAEIWQEMELKYLTDVEFHVLVDRTHLRIEQHAGPKGPALFKAYTAFAIYVALFTPEEIG